MPQEIFWIGAVSAMILLTLYFWFAEVGEEIAVVDRRSYTGYKAVQVNREITREFEGALTDEKIQDILEKYGLPSQTAENMPGWRDGNYLSDFVVRYFTNGSWERGITPTESYSLESSSLGKACADREIIPTLAYTKGWSVFIEILQLGFILGSILVICTVSPVFAEEDQVKMLSLILTTEEGVKKSIIAKYMAAFTATLFIFVGIIGSSLLLCNLVYGVEGFENISNVVLLKNTAAGWELNFSEYLGIMIGYGLQAFFLLCCFCLWISAGQKSSFLALILAGVCWGAPVLLRMIFWGPAGLLLYATPIFLVMNGTIEDTYTIWIVVLGLSLLMGIGCMLGGIRSYIRPRD